MESQPIHLSTSSVCLPDDWRAVAGMASDGTGAIPFVLDVIRQDDTVHVYLASRCSAPDFVEQLTYFIDGERAKVMSTHPVPRSMDVSLESLAGSDLEIRAGDKSVHLAITDDVTDQFEDLNTAFAFEIDPTEDAIVDWLTYSVRHQNLQAAVVLRRLPAKGRPSTRANRLLKAVAGIDGLQSFALLDCALPIGAPGAVSLRERVSTPDGPGKGLLKTPKPNPFEAPIHEVGLLDAVRCRTFARARATLFCTIADLVSTAQGNGSVFDAASTSTSYLKFSGTLVYPWAYAKPARPRHADHLCRSFDGRSGENIWCAGKTFMTTGPALRPFRASTVQPDEKSDSFTYARCMGLRFPKLKIGQIVPKSSLVRDDTVAKLMAKAFDHGPKEPPAAKSGRPATTKNDKVLIVTTMKNEGPFILEWLAYHKSIGVTDFCVYTNDCTDGTDDMFDLLAKKGLLEHRENPYRKTGQKPQHAAYHDAGKTEIAKAADWIICMDVDEYINIHTGDGTLTALFDAIGDANIISMTWRLFGNGEVDQFKDQFITEQFIRCAPHLARKPHQAWGFKTLFRNNGHYKKFGVHRPVGLQPEYLNQVKWVNGSGKKMPPNILRTGWRSSLRTYGYDLVTLNHYALRSAESFLVKRDRGRVNHVSRDQGLTYWFRMNNNKEEDTAIFRNLPRARAVFDQLMSDPDIAAQHALCVANHTRRIAELKERPDYVELYNEMMSARLIELSRHHDLLGNAVFLAGPDSVPKDIPPKTEAAPPEA